MSLQEVRNQRIYLQSQLKNYLNDPIINEKEITITRGRILRAYVKEYNLETDLGVKARIQTLIRQEADLHKSQVNERIKKVKADKNISVVNQISNELALKFRRLATNARSVVESRSNGELIKNATNTVGNTLSLGATALKAPIMVVLRLSSYGIQYAARLAVQPLHIPVYLFSKIINPEGSYQGKMINNMGKILGDELSLLLRQTEKGVRKI
ncbi:unknown [Firmicutes bacterium CAG:884]|nr:hypothetical protein [Bacillota bacterium]CCY94541.1 unknown [Firmicutes bacterium CAG:884]